MHDWLDTNVILRFLLADHTDHSPRARQLIEDAPRQGRMLQVPPFVVAEVVYVLEGEDFERNDIVRSLQHFMRLPGIHFVDEETVLEALIAYRDGPRVDFADALLMATAAKSGGRVWTFNTRDFRRLGGAWAEP